MSGYVARLTHGSDYLPLDSTGRVKLGAFLPPVTSEIPQTGGGTSANRRGGSELVSVRAVNRDFSFSIIVTGSSDAECERAIREVELFLNLHAGDSDVPLYLEWRSDNNVAFEPLWGQFGANKRVQIEWGEIMRQPTYTVSDLRSRAQKADVRVQIRPYAMGKRQRLALAKGGVYQDIIGTTDGISRGTGIPEATTNKMTNPVFGHATYSNGWTADASLVASQNTNTRFTLPGTISSVKLTARATGQEFYQSIDAGNTNSHTLSCYAKRPDGAAVSSDDAVLFYGSAQTTVFTSVGNGWYRLTWTGAGVAAARNTGVQVKNGRTVYVAGSQFEEKSLATPLCFGDMMGCSWAGTAHASTSTRAVSFVKIPVAVTQDAFNLAEATYRAVWKAPYASTADGDRYLFSVDIVGEYVRYVAADDTFEFSDATNTATTAAQTFAAGDVLVFHFVRSPDGGLVLYKNGASAATNATYTPTTMPTYFYIGSDSTPANHAGGVFMDFAIYDQAMTAAEVLADYNNISPLVSDNQRLSPIPYLWNKDGDGIVDNCDDSSRDNWVVADGIPGSVPAETWIFGATSAAFSTIGAVWLSNFATRNFHYPSGIIFHDQSGTADVGNSSGDAYLQTSVDTNDTTIGSSGSIIPSEGVEELLGREFIVACRLGDSGSDLSIRSQFIIGQTINSDYKAIDSDTTFYFFVTKQRVFPGRQGIFRSNEGETPLLAPENIQVNLQGKRSTGTDNVQVDYIALLCRPYLKIGSTASSDSGFVYWSRVKAAGGIGSSTGYLYALADFSLALAGDNVFELEPERRNLIMSFMGDAAAAPTITRTITYTMYVVPRWSLL